MKNIYIYFLFQEKAPEKNVKRHVNFLSWFESFTSLGSKKEMEVGRLQTVRRCSISKWILELYAI